MTEKQQHAGSVTSPPTSSTKPEPEPEKTKSGPPKKAKPLIGRFEYIGQDENRLLFQDRADKKCYTVDKRHLVYRGEGGFRVEAIESLQK